MNLELELVKAADSGDVDQVIKLMSKGANIRDSKALFTASEHGHLDIVLFLISNGANIEEIESPRLCSIIINAVKHGRNDVIEALLNSGANFNQSDLTGTTPLYCAICWEIPEIVPILLKHGANVNVPDRYMNTPLHIACLRGYSELVKLLVAVPEIKINAMNNKFETPLHVASEDKNIEIVRLLLDNGADPDLRDNNGKTAFDLYPTPVLSEVIKSFQLERQEQRGMENKISELETKNKEQKKMLEETKKREVELEKKVEDLERQLKRKEDGEKMERGDDIKIFEEVVDRLKTDLKLRAEEFERKLESRLDGIESQFREDKTSLEDSNRDVNDRLSHLEASFRRVNMSENNRPLRGARREPKPIKCGSALNSRIKAGEKRPPTTSIGKALFVSWLAHDLLSDDLRDALVEDEGIASAVCVRLRTKNPDATHSSFYVSCKDESDYERLSDPSIWPVNCVIGEFRGPLRDHLKHRSELEARH